MANPPPRLPDRKYLDAAALEMGHADWFKVPCAFMTDENVAIITRAWQLNVAALSPTPPTPSLSTDVQSAATGLHEHDVSLKGAMPVVGEVCSDCGGYGEYFGHSPDCAEDSCALAGGVDDCDGQVFVCLFCDPTPTLATVAAGDDEGVQPCADDPGCPCRSCETKDAGIERADLIEALTEFADKIDRFGFVNALDGHATRLRSAIRLLSQGGGK
jgi:hypothetical protein